MRSTVALKIGFLGLLFAFLAPKLVSAAPLTVKQVNASTAQSINGTLQVSGTYNGLYLSVVGQTFSSSYSVASGLTGNFNQISIYSNFSGNPTSTRMVLDEYDTGTGNLISDHYFCLVSQYGDILTYQLISGTTDCTTVLASPNTYFRTSGFVVSSTNSYELGILTADNKPTTILYGSAADTLQGFFGATFGGACPPSNAFCTTLTGGETIADLAFDFGSTLFYLSDLPNSTSTALTITCDPSDGAFANSFCKLGIALFQPSQDALFQFGLLQQKVSNKPPFGYVSAITTALGNLSGSASSTVDLSALSGITIFDDVKTLLQWLLWLAFGFWVFRKFRHIIL